MGCGERTDVGRRGADHWADIRVYAEAMWTTEGCKQGIYWQVLCFRKITLEDV